MPARYWAASTSVKYMLHIITGEVNTGKTTRMRALFLQKEAADGLVSEKIWEDGKFRGYRLVHLQGRETMELALLKDEYHGQFPTACRFGPFVFSQPAFQFGADLLKQLCMNPAINSVFLDEVGPLELKGQGFASILPVLLHSRKNLFLTIRGDCLNKFLEKHKIEHCLLVSTSNHLTI